MYLAEDCHHAWVQKLDLSRVDFGKGKRMLVKGGRLTLSTTSPCLYRACLKGVNALSMNNSPYFKQAQLMLRVIPHVAAETCFALKGGTAINLFLRDMPRLSVDIDLTYLPLEPRPLAVQQYRYSSCAHCLSNTCNRNGHDRSRKPLTRGDTHCQVVRPYCRGRHKNRAKPCTARSGISNSGVRLERSGGSAV